MPRKQLDRARAAHYPTLALQGNYEINTEDFSDSQDNYSVGAVLQINLFSGQGISGRSAEAKAMTARIKAMREGLALNVRVETQRAYYQAKAPGKASRWPRPLWIRPKRRCASLPTATAMACSPW